MRDLMNILSATSEKTPGAQITATTSGDWIDLDALNSGNDGICFLVHVGTVTDGTHTFTLEESPDGGSTVATVAAPYLQTPSGQSNVVTSATAAKTILKFGYLGSTSVKTIGDSVSPVASGKMQVRIKNTVSGSPGTGGYFSILAVEGLSYNQPAA